MNILVYGINYYPELTGTGKYTGEMCEWLAQRGHRVDIITGMPFYPDWTIHENYKNKKWHKEIINGVHVYRTPLYVPTNVTGKTRILNELTFGINSLVHWLTRIFCNYDIVIGICPPMQMGMMPYAYKIIRRKPFIFHIQDLQVDMAKNLGMLKNGYLLKFLDIVETFLLKRATAVTTISEGMKNRISSKINNTTTLIEFPNWVDIEHIRPISNLDSLKKAFGFKDNDKIILYSGSIGEKQGLNIVIEVADMMKSNRNIYFVFIGGGSGKVELERMVRRKDLDNVKFYPIQPYSDLPKILGMADLHLVIQKESAFDLVMPSKLTSILAAGGVAIISATEKSSLYNTVTSNNIGIIVNPEDPENLYEIISNNLNNALDEIRFNARNYAENNLKMDSILEQFEVFMFKLISKT